VSVASTLEDRGAATDSQNSSQLMPLDVVGMSSTTDFTPLLRFVDPIVKKKMDYEVETLLADTAEEVEESSSHQRKQVKDKNSVDFLLAESADEAALYEAAEEMALAEEALLAEAAEDAILAEAAMEAFG